MSFKVGVQDSLVRKNCVAHDTFKDHPVEREIKMGQLALTCSEVYLFSCTVQTHTWSVCL